jgi:histidinol-phosphate aminotransferase
MKRIEELVRPNIQKLAPYSCARDEFKGEASIYMDANESCLAGPDGRYPDPLQTEIKEKLRAYTGLRPEQMMLGNGSDEPIDLVYRVFCNPGVDNVVAIAPTYGMYKVAADINDIEYRSVMLEEGSFALNAEKLLAATDAKTKVVWMCSPNNPTGNKIGMAEMEKVLEKFEGIVVVDEAYGDFTDETMLGKVADGKHKNLIVLKTFSKAWGLAGIRCGMAFADASIIALFNKVKYPYNVNILTQRRVLEALGDEAAFRRDVRTIVEARDMLEARLRSGEIGSVRYVYATDANFVLVKFDDPVRVYKALVERGIITRNRNSVTMCEGCLRITTGTKAENEELLKALKEIG